MKKNKAWRWSQIFLSTDSIAYSSAFYGQGTGTIWLDDVQCTGNEASLINCPANSLGSHNCTHAHDAGVRCQIECKWSASISDQLFMRYNLCIICVSFGKCLVYDYRCREIALEALSHLFFLLCKKPLQHSQTFLFLHGMHASVKHYPIPTMLVHIYSALARF